MRETTTLENAIGKVHEISQNNYDEIMPVRDMNFESLERMDIAGRSFGVLPSAQRLLANRLRVPERAWPRLPLGITSPRRVALQAPSGL